MPEIRQSKNHAVSEAAPHPTVKQGKNMTFFFLKNT